MKINWDMPATALTAREYLLISIVQGLVSALNYGPGVIVNSWEIADDALDIAEKVEKKNSI